MAETTSESGAQGAEAVELEYCRFDDGVWCVLGEMLTDSSRLIPRRMRLIPLGIDLGTTKARRMLLGVEML